MDPASAVSLAASVAQLAGLAKSALCHLIQYYEAVVEAPKRSQELRQEIMTLCDLLDTLKSALNSKVAGSHFTTSESLIESITDFQQLLTLDITPRIQASQTKGLNRLRWPFTKVENERLLQKMDRYKEAFNMALGLKTT
jgi:hypothetical protein